MKILENGTAKMDKNSPEYIRYKKASFFPPQVLIDTVSHCNLNCAMCPRQYKPRKWGWMDDDLAVKLIDEIAETEPDTRIWFCYFGEPLVAKNKKNGLFERIAYAKKKGVRRTVINSNANLMDEKCVDKMIRSGLDEIYIGIDAATPETYAKVRRGGDYNTVLKNIDYLLKVQREGGMKIPELTVQFGVYDENEHEVGLFEKYWKGKGVKVFIRPKLTWIGYLEDKVKTKEKRWPCSWFFDSINIIETGEVPYCVCDWANRIPFGDVHKESIKDIWQKKIRHYQILQAEERWEELPEFCRQCTDWQTKTKKSAEFLRYFKTDAPY